MLLASNSLVTPLALSFFFRDPEFSSCGEIRPQQKPDFQKREVAVTLPASGSPVITVALVVEVLLWSLVDMAVRRRLTLQELTPLIL